MASPVHRAAMLPHRMSLALLTLEASHRQEEWRQQRRSQEKMGCWEGKEGMRGKNTKLAWSSPEEGVPQGCLALFIFLGLSTRLLSQRTAGSPCGGKDKGLPTGSLLCLDGECPYQPIWCLPESLSIVSSTQTSLSLSPEPWLPRAYLLVTGASISRVPKHILHGINRENKVARPFTGSFREAWVWGDRGNSALLSYLARCSQLRALRQSNGRCSCCCSLFC